MIVEDIKQFVLWSGVGRWDNGCVDSSDAKDGTPRFKSTSHFMHGMYGFLYEVEDGSIERDVPSGTGWEKRRWKDERKCRNQSNRRNGVWRRGD
eukprot:evm.model.NODE_12976_length_9629_cov_36.188908.2